MIENTTLQVTRLGKRFKLYTSPWHRMREWFSIRRRKYHTPFWANREISFEVEKGEFFGIIGVNGAGKTTLLKMLSGILVPTEGSYQLKGQVLSLLELGGNFKKELTGRENILRAAQLLNLPKSYIQEQIEKMWEFSELGDFFDRQVNTYSSGMLIRLSFSLFAFLECDVLILDEALAVGDIFFRQKCYQRLDELIAKGTSIILVTHNMSVVKKYCQRVLVMHQGRKLYLGKPDEAIRVYAQAQNTASHPEIQRELLKKMMMMEESSDLDLSKPSSLLPISEQDDFWPDEAAFTAFPIVEKPGRAQLVKFALCDEKGQPGHVFKQDATAHLYYEIELKREVPVPFAQISIRDTYNTVLHTRSTLQLGAEHPPLAAKGARFRFRQTIQLGLMKGQYTLGLSFFSIPIKLYKQFSAISADELTTNRLTLICYEPLVSLMIFPAVDEICSGVFGGLCNLPGECRIEQYFEKLQDTK